LEVIMKTVLSKAAALALLAALLLCAASLSSCDSIMFTGYKGEKGDKGDKGDPGSGSTSPTASADPAGAGPLGKAQGSEISPSWAVSLISRDKYEFTIEDNAAPAYDTGQGVEYSVTLSGKRAAAPSGQGWIEGSGGEVTFEGLTPDTDYYVWARTKGNAAYGAGPARSDVGGMVTTRPLREDPFAFASLTGERNAMYYLEPDPADPDKKLQLSSPASPPTALLMSAADFRARFKGGYAIVNPSNIPFQSKIEFSFPISGLVGLSPASVSASGYCGVLSSPDSAKLPESYYENEVKMGPAYIAFSGKSITLSAKANDYTANAYPAPEPFSEYNGNMELPISRPYSSALRVNRNVTFSVPVSASQLESLISLSDPVTHPNSYNGAGTGWYDFIYVYNHATEKVGVDLLATATTNERHKLSSLGYYQYLTLAVVYPPDISVFNITASPIVESFYHDADTNTVSAVFKDYDSPYSGPVLTYTLVTEGGQQQLKTLEIK
jgi:hypothetical protein